MELTYARIIHCGIFSSFTLDNLFLVNYTNCIGSNGTVAMIQKEGVKLMIHIDYRDAAPIYEQIKSRVKKLIITGVLKDGDRLPSVRALATELAINPNTIQKAYGELETEGYIYSLPGKGSFASNDVERDERRIITLKNHLCEILLELRFLGVNEDEILQLLTQTGGYNNHD